MKKHLMVMLLAAAAQNINAQLVVHPSGRVGVGTNIPQAMFSVGSSGDTISAIYCKSSDKIYGISSNNYFSYIYTTYGMAAHVQNSIGDCIGVKSVALGPNTSSQSAIGISGLASQASTSIGLFGGKYFSSTGNFFAGVFGSETSSTPSFGSFSGTYAGFFNGKVRVTDGIYATILSPSATASSSGQDGFSGNEAVILSDREESVTDKLSQVQTLQFLRYSPVKEVSTVKDASKSISTEIDLENMSQEEIEALEKSQEEDTSEPSLAAIQYGLAADQLKKVYPELVYEDENGNVSINYVEMVPLLVKSINELTQRINELENDGTSSKKTKSKSRATTIEGTTSDVDIVRMDQNKPNPFSESTVITLNIPEKTQKADIFINDMSGKQVQTIPVNERGETNITVYASDLTAGMYIYTLVVDGKVKVTRKMIVTVN